MPCRDDYPQDGTEATRLRAELEPLLCEAVDLLDQLEGKGATVNMSKKLRAWAKKHEAGEQVRIRQEALEKLTPKERRALGLDK
jgi:hypothetical protein